MVSTPLLESMKTKLTGKPKQKICVTTRDSKGLSGALGPHQRQGDPPSHQWLNDLSRPLRPWRPVQHIGSMFANIAKHRHTGSQPSQHQSSDKSWPREQLSCYPCLEHSQTQAPHRHHAWPRNSTCLLMPHLRCPHLALQPWPLHNLATAPHSGSGH